MSTESELGSTKDPPSLRSGIVARVTTVAVGLALNVAILFLAAGSLRWTWAWVYVGICLATVAFVGPITLRYRPETVAERSRFLATQDWDRAIAALYLLAFYVTLPLLAGLGFRFGWAQLPGTAWKLAGAVALAAGLGLVGWAMVANAYFSTAVRIQSDRGHTVCRSGPYRFVRHPGYAGYCLQPLGTALLLGSLWALIPALAAVILMVMRTAREDRFLQAGLPGYRDYATDVEYRLVPGAW